MNLFENTKIRMVRDKDTNELWISVVDVCAAVLNCDYQKARNYWKWLKHKLDLECMQTERATNRLKLEAADGRLRYTDVADIVGIIRLIQIFPSPKAHAFRLWIAELASQGANVTEKLAKAVQNAKDKIRKKAGNLLMTVTRKDFDIFGEWSEAAVTGTDGEMYINARRLWPFRC